MTAPTCTERGYTRHVCSACGDSYQDTYVAALGHNYFLVKDPLWGQEIYRCIRCGHIKVEDEIPIIPVDLPVEAASYSLAGEPERVLGSTVVQEYAYVYNGSSLMQMVVQTTVDDGEPVTETLYFSYDATGNPMSVLYNGTDYYYTVSLQGDVTAILNTSGTAVVEYTYDAWGNILSVTGSMADTLGAVNPLTYRGYVYDTETGLYYLQSRYYNPEIGRFLNADAFTYTGGLLGNNMFAYCGNNPVMRADPDGEFWVLAGIITVGLFLLSGCSSDSEPEPEPEPPKSNVEPYASYGGGTGNVYIVTEDKVAEVENIKRGTDVIIVDYRTNADPNMQIKQSYKIGNKNHQKEIAQMMIDYNSQNPVDPAWSRSVDSLVEEWRFHNFAYSIRYKRERTADTDFNNNDEGKGFWDFVKR